jgi:hypothetical protein
VSIQAGAVAGAAYRGIEPQAKTSMTIMRPPQCGHGRGRIRGPSGSVFSAASASLISATVETASSARLGDILRAPAIGQQAVMTDAVEALRDRDRRRRRYWPCEPVQVTLIVPRASAVPALAAVMGFEGNQRYIRGADELSARRRRRTRKGQDCNNIPFHRCSAKNRHGIFGRKSAHARTNPHDIDGEF